jgi:hypothetical protein
MSQMKHLISARITYVYFELSAHKRRPEGDKYYNYCSLLFTNVINSEGNPDNKIGSNLLEKLLESL